MKPMTKEDVKAECKKKNIKFIRLCFTDIQGKLKSLALSYRELEDALDRGAGFDGSSIEGYRDIEESDMLAFPDPETFSVLPWQEGVATMFCDIYTPDKRPYPGDPRQILKRQLEIAKEMGYTFYLGPEIEYFYFKDDTSTEMLDRAGYFDLEHLDITSQVRKETVLTLESMGIGVECDHHEVAPSQHEIDIQYNEALKMADMVQTYKAVVKEIARKNGIYATFMPKPVYGINGSGMHTHVSFFKNGTNAFWDKGKKHSISDAGRHFVAGVLKHAGEICSVTNPSINSYKRLVPGYEAPVYIAWSKANRSALVRIPDLRPGDEKATRMELRNPDPSGNPYLQFASIIAAGLEGVKNKYELCEAVDKNIYEMSSEEKEKLNIPTLPGSLGEAIEVTAESKLMRQTLGEHTFNRFIEIKRMEWDEYRKQVTDYEIRNLLPEL